MIRQTFVSTLAVLAFGVLAVACKAGGVGDPCIPNLEYSPDTDTPAETGADVEDRSFQCETRVCLTNHFRGRVSCPFGNSAGRSAIGHTNADLPNKDEAEAECYVPGTRVKVNSQVQPQCLANKDNVYCSCRCGGDSNNAANKGVTYCECPEGFECAEVTSAILPGSAFKPKDKYCVRKGNDRTQDNQICDNNKTCDYKASDNWCGYTKNAAKIE
jgi:hypothetical protein